MIRIITDGACRQGSGRGGNPLPEGTGGWAAIVDDRAGPRIIHGRKSGTTNGEMELMAAIEGLRSMHSLTEPRLFTDYDEIGHVHWMWRGGEMPTAEHLKRRGRDLWLDLIDEFERVRPVIVTVGKRSPLEHRALIRAAHHAARAAMRGDDPAGDGRLRKPLCLPRTTT